MLLLGVPDYLDNIQVGVKNTLKSLSFASIAI